MTCKRRPTAGDKVRIMSVADFHTDMGFDVGQVHTIDEDDGSIAAYRIGEAWFNEHRVELVEDEPSRSRKLAYALIELVPNGSVEAMLVSELIQELKNHE